MKNSNNKKQLRRRRAVSKLLLLTAMISTLMMLISVNYKIHSYDYDTDAMPQWEITNATSWTIYVRDVETGEKVPIQAEQTTTLARGSSGEIEAFGTFGQETFTTPGSRITFLEQEKGQITLRNDDEVCPDGQCEEYDFRLFQ